MLARLTNRRRRACRLLEQTELLTRPQRVGSKKKNKNGSIIYLISLQFMGTMSTIWRKKTRDWRTDGFARTRMSPGNGVGHGGYPLPRLCLWYSKHSMHWPFEWKRECVHYTCMARPKRRATHLVLVACTHAYNSIWIFYLLLLFVVGLSDNCMIECSYVSVAHLFACTASE